MELVFSKKALQQIVVIKSCGLVSVQKKLSLLFAEIEIHPTLGTGHVERLKKYKIPTYSRKIDQKNRLIYSLPVDENVVEILPIIGHYGDK